MPTWLQWLLGIFIVAPLLLLVLLFASIGEWTTAVTLAFVAGAVTFSPELVRLVGRLAR